MNLIYIIIIIVVIKPEILSVLKEELSKQSSQSETKKESKPDKTQKHKRKKGQIKLTIFGDEQPLEVWAQRADYSPIYLRQIYNKEGEETVKEKIRNKLYNK